MYSFEQLLLDGSVSWLAVSSFLLFCPSRSSVFNLIANLVATQFPGCYANRNKPYEPQQTWYLLRGDTASSAAFCMSHQWVPQALILQTGGTIGICMTIGLSIIIFRRRTIFILLLDVADKM